MRTFSARETEWLRELDGIELASFKQRAVAFVLDWIFIWLGISLIAAIVAVGALGVLRLQGKPLPDFQHFSSRWLDDNNHTLADKKLADGAEVKIERLEDSEVEHVLNRIVLPVLYFGILLWRGKGQTPGKRIMKIRVVSTMHRHITFWHSVERALGYGAAALEAGFGFVQFFIHPYRRCAQDRLAETLVVTERSYRALQHRLDHPLVPDGAPATSPG